MNREVKCVTCQRSYESTKFSVDCPHDVELSADLLRSTQVRPPVSVPPYTHKPIKEPIVEDPHYCHELPIDDSIKPEDITDEMLDEWLAKRVRATPINDYTKSYCSEVERSLMAAAINIYREHTAESINLDL